ncbi:conserved hypothetical protein [Bradyrhizobium sp. ORS 278]|uniref:hypothetical protein n=1 Tax=Bradyrhizobium sp. (strain ORS 278) TaxID=114615 RepID=UPI00015084EF|nr:hypothetical protein [Bradyrhizobium sp. ORS 278]CAL80030.1 conserved hypothetical protein [Bradyrhizobium sp. ORS 278]
MSESRKPSHDAFAVAGTGRNATWTRIGAAWPNEDGKGFNIVIAPGVAVSGKIVLREPRAPTDPEGE